MPAPSSRVGAGQAALPLGPAGERAHAARHGPWCPACVDLQPVVEGQDRCRDCLDREEHRQLLGDLDARARD